MYAKINRQRSFYDLGYDDYLASLAAKHAILEKAIQEETGRPAPDGLSLTQLKRQKLRTKDQIARLRARLPRTASSA